MPLKIEDLLFVDFEASSLDPASWPIEVGIAWIEDHTVQSWSSLIRPAPDWSMEYWSAQSAAIHNIPRNSLETAPEARDIAREFIRRMKGKALISDAPQFESRWATRLLRSDRDCDEIAFSDYDAAAAHFFDGMASIPAWK